MADKVINLECYKNSLTPTIRMYQKIFDFINDFGTIIEFRHNFFDENNKQNFISIDHDHYLKIISIIEFHYTNKLDTWQDICFFLEKMKNNKIRKITLIFNIKTGKYNVIRISKEKLEEKEGKKIFKVERSNYLKNEKFDYDDISNLALYIKGEINDFDKRFFFCIRMVRVSDNM